jgi:hypothetical protein
MKFQGNRNQGPNKEKKPAKYYSLSGVFLSCLARRYFFCSLVYSILWLEDLQRIKIHRERGYSYCPLIWNVATW